MQVSYLYLYVGTKKTLYLCWNNDNLMLMLELSKSHVYIKIKILCLYLNNEFHVYVGTIII